MLQKPAADTTVEDDDPHGLSTLYIQHMCEDLNPEEERVLEDYMDVPGIPVKVTLRRTRKQYDLSVVQRSTQKKNQKQVSQPMRGIF